MNTKQTINESDWEMNEWTTEQEKKNDDWNGKKWTREKLMILID